MAVSNSDPVPLDAPPIDIEAAVGKEERRDGEEEEIVSPADLSESPASKDAPGASWKKNEQHEIPKNNLPAVFFGLMLATFLAALDMTVVATALPTMQRKLNGGQTSYAWVGTAYMLASTCAVPFWGKISGILGRKPILYTTIVLFLFGSALCGAAQNMTWLCICRAVQGIGGGGILVMTNIVISDIVSLQDRGKYTGFIGSTWGAAAVLGPLVGGLLTDHVSWRWVFLINLPTGGFALGVLIFCLNLNPHKTMSFQQFYTTFDFGGLALVIGGVVLLLVGFSYGETDWNNARTIGLLAGGAVVLVGSAFYESWTKRSPIIPPRLFKTRTTAALLTATFIHSFSFLAASYYIVLYFQIRGSSATMSGVELMPLSVGSSVVSIASGFLLSKIGRYRMLIIVSYLICVLGYALLATLDERSNRAQEELYLLVAGIGVGPLFQAPLVALQASMPLAEMATSTATLALLRSLGGTIGIAVGGAIYSSQTRRGLQGIAGFDAEASLRGSIQVLHTIEPVELRNRVMHAYTRGTSTIWIVCAPLFLVAALLSFLLKEYSLARKVVRGAGAKSDKAASVTESDKSDSTKLDSGSAADEDVAGKKEEQEGVKVVA